MASSLRALVGLSAVFTLTACQGPIDVESLPTERPVRSLDGTAGECPKYFQGIKAGVITCRCPTSRTLGELGTVWGNNPYTDSSDICRAAQHAGIDTRTGPITVHQLHGCTSYKGATANGVIFRDRPAVACSKYGTSGRRVSSTNPKHACGRRFDVSRTEYSCTCDRPTGGSVWGSHPFTADSAPCKAAYHLGLVTKPGTRVTMRRAPGCDSYKGSSRNGITTFDWGKYATSYVFVQPGKNPPGCPP